jgi:hypothetical protein
MCGRYRRTTAEEEISSQPYLRGLDTIRFISAFWVFLGHGAAPASPNPFPDGTLSNLLFRAIYDNLWNGGAAVIIFFVISGFCIHYPSAGSNTTPNLPVFYTRRYLRILIASPTLHDGSAKSDRTVRCLVVKNEACRQQHHHLCHGSGKRVAEDLVTVQVPSDHSGKRATLLIGFLRVFEDRSDVKFAIRSPRVSLVVADS